mmetsp:Transcript_12662/g.39297  ORF Transcript_12662/g.39297 Transcript_12662/m.39297 type:complete len:250 (+) Transcript_12662:1685-2434(+)
MLRLLRDATLLTLDVPRRLWVHRRLDAPLCRRGGVNFHERLLLCFSGRPADGARNRGLLLVLLLEGVRYVCRADPVVDHDARFVGKARVHGHAAHLRPGGVRRVAANCGSHAGRLRGRKQCLVVVHGVLVVALKLLRPPRDGAALLHPAGVQDRHGPPQRAYGALLSSAEPEQHPDAVFGCHLDGARGRTAGSHHSRHAGDRGGRGDARPALARALEGERAHHEIVHRSEDVVLLLCVHPGRGPLCHVG